MILIDSDAGTPGCHEQETASHADLPRTARRKVHLILSKNPIQLSSLEIELASTCYFYRYRINFKAETI